MPWMYPIVLGLFVFAGLLADVPFWKLLLFSLPIHAVFFFDRLVKLFGGDVEAIVEKYVRPRIKRIDDRLAGHTRPAIESDRGGTVRNRTCKHANLDLVEESIPNNLYRCKDCGAKLTEMDVVYERWN